MEPALITIAYPAIGCAIAWLIGWLAEEPATSVDYVMVGLFWFPGLLLLLAVFLMLIPFVGYSWFQMWLHDESAA